MQAMERVVVMEHIVEIPDSVRREKHGERVGFMVGPTRHVGVNEEVIRCRDCKHYIPEETWQEERGIGLYETVGEPPSCKKWSCIILDEDGKSSVYRPDVRPDGFCAWAVRRDG